MTHQHGDHVSQLEAVVDAFDPDVYAYANHPARTHPLADGDEVTIGDETFDVVSTPGHADDHVSFVSDRSLFSGDVVVHDDGAFDYGSFGRTDMAGQSRERLIESIGLLERMPDGVSRMYAGHGGVFEGDVRDVVETALERAEKREPKYPTSSPVWAGRSRRSLRPAIRERPVSSSRASSRCSRRRSPFRPSQRRCQLRARRPATP